MKMMQDSLQKALTTAIAGLLAIALTGCTAVSTAGSKLQSTTDNTLHPESSGPGSLTFGGSTIDLSQNGGSATFAVNRSGGSTGAVTVHYATADGTAMAGVDYQAVSGTLSWADGDATVKNITFNDLEYAAFSGTRTMTINLSTPTGGATLGTYPTRTVNITDTFTAPATLSSMDLSKWKETLPVDIYRGSGGTGGTQYAAQSISPSVLSPSTPSHGFADSYFYASGSSVIFRDVSNGAVTSPGSGSDHTRSELRELYTGIGHDSNSDWNSSIGGTLTGTCVIQAVSVDSDEATIAQIHGQDNAFMLLIFRPAYNDIQVIVYTTNGGSAYTRTTVVTGVNIGDSISYSINYSGTTITTTVDGTPYVYSGVDSTWTGTGVYFKLGAYAAAPNTGNPSGDKTQVAYQSFSVSHP